MVLILHHSTFLSPHCLLFLFDRQTDIRCCWNEVTCNASLVVCPGCRPLISGRIRQAWNIRGCYLTFSIVLFLWTDILVSMSMSTTTANTVSHVCIAHVHLPLVVPNLAHCTWQSPTLFQANEIPIFVPVLRDDRLHHDGAGSNSVHDWHGSIIAC